MGGAACGKVIIDYGAVQAAAASLADVALSSELRSASLFLSSVAERACASEVKMLDADVPTPPQLARMEKLWMDSCARAVTIGEWRKSIASGNNEPEIHHATLMDLWADEMLRVPREVAEGKVPQ